MNDALKRFLLEHDELADLDPAARRLAVRQVLTDDPHSGLTVSGVVEYVDGAGPLTALMNDPEITDILVNGPREVWVERAGALEPADVTFEDAESMLALIDRWLGEAGASADISHPIADARLRDGSRLHVVLPPVSAVPLVSIRRLPRSAPALGELVERGMLTVGEADLLAASVADRRSMVIGGPTGTGKTTLMASLLALVPATERVVILEETRELPCAAPNVVSLVTRRPNEEGTGGIDLTDLVRAALRMRPDRIVVGEVRGPEALALIGTMNTGHRGSLVTVHASSSERVVDRLVSLAMQADTSLAERTVRHEAECAWDLFVHLERIDRVRRVVEIREAR